ncbi:hypothetical protein C8A03DRAFT_35393 [Achaetomium macrosporum]|uniref:Uncharacterized protein n=1 Tax=Achaetomium macrosporum TaxID=79813 RepID=A0AAN7HAU8_9PEZI|nr:hypothetical protein C8A03DRAFT_35393 [Achaetomium macrosporum]
MDSDGLPGPAVSLAIESKDQFLTLRLLLFEVTDGTRTLTDEIAQRFTWPFTPDLPWDASVHRAGQNAHYELRLVHRTIARRYDRAAEKEATDAIDSLCRQFCDADGLLSPRCISPNPNLVFTVGVDPN